MDVASHLSFCECAALEKAEPITECLAVILQITERKSVFHR